MYLKMEFGNLFNRFMEGFIDELCYVNFLSMFGYLFDVLFIIKWYFYFRNVCYFRNL